MASDDLRARIAEALAGLRFGLDAGRRYGLSGREVEEATEQLLPFVQAALAGEQELSQTLMEQRQQMAAERFVWQERGDRYRLAWRSARQRAEAYSEGIFRHVAARDQWKSWAGKQEARAVKAEAALAEYERVRASVTAGEPLGRALTVSEVLEQHEVTRKALIHALDQGLHLNWRQVIEAAGRMRRAAFDWMKDFEQAQAERDAALAALQAVREAQSLGEALAAVAKHDGLTTQELP